MHTYIYRRYYFNIFVCCIHSSCPLTSSPPHVHSPPPPLLMSTQFLLPSLCPPTASISHICICMELNLSQLDTASFGYVRLLSRPPVQSLSKFVLFHLESLCPDSLLTLVSPHIVAKSQPCPAHSGGSDDLGMASS